MEPSFPAAGIVRSVAVSEGDRVEADAVVTTQDKTLTEAAIAQAQAALARAQAQVAELRAGPRLQEITAAQARLEAARACLAQLTEGARPQETAAARAELAAAQASLQQLYDGPGPEEEITAFTALSNAEAALKQAQAAYDRVAWRNDIGSLPESRQLQEATNNYNAAQARYEALRAGPDAGATAAARARIQQAQAGLDRLLSPATQSQVAELEAQARAAQAELDLLSAGTRGETIAVAAAGVTEAEAALQRALADLARFELRAPMAGTITARAANPGEMVLAGQPVATLADLSHLQVETTDLSEKDVARVAVGQAVTVYVEALGTELPGRVTRVAPRANAVGGDTVYSNSKCDPSCSILSGARRHFRRAESKDVAHRRTLRRPSTPSRQKTAGTPLRAPPLSTIFGIAAPYTRS